MNLILVETPQRTKFLGLVRGSSYCSICEVAVTELATFLRGLGTAHGALLARGGGASVAAPAEPGGAGEEVDVLPLLAEFYGPEEWTSFLTVAVVGADDDAGRHARHAAHRCRGVRFTTRSAAAAPKVVQLDAGGSGRQLLAELRGRPGLQCEPLHSASPLLAAYRSVRQRLGQLRRTSNAEPAAGSGDSRPLSPSNPSSPSSSGPGRRPMTAASRPPSDDVDRGSRFWTAMVFGKTGAGKSHLANLLVGHAAFESGDSLASVTSEKSVRKATSRDGALTVLDTIGFGDTRLPAEAVVRSLRDTALEVPMGIDVLLFCLKKERVSTMEQEQPYVC